MDLPQDNDQRPDVFVSVYNEKNFRDKIFTGRLGYIRINANDPDL